MYSGTPGSGKSLHTAEDIYNRLVSAHKNVIANFPINWRLVKYSKHEQRKQKLFKRFGKAYAMKKRSTGQFYYFSDDVVTPALLMRYAKKFHTHGKENQTLLVLDECNSDGLFNNRSWQNKNRNDWVSFFRLHRRLGFKVVLVSQSDKLIDKSIRCFVEYEVKHRKVNNFKLLGKLLGVLSGGAMFVAVEMWYGLREKVGSHFFHYSKFYGEFYDSYMEFK